jgi:DNA-binding protein HU-beta
VNKSQLIDTLAARFDGNKKDAQYALEAVLDTITRTVASGERVAITGFGAFEKLDRPARMVRNPATGVKKRAKKTSVPKFRAGANLKAVVSGAKKLPRLAATKAAPAAKAPAAKAPATKAAKAPAKSPAKRAAVKATTAKKTATKATTTRATKKAPAKKTTAKRAVKR